MRRSITWRLSFCQIAVVTIAMLVIAVLGEASLRHYYMARLEHQLFLQASLVRRAVLEDLLGPNAAEDVNRLVRGLATDTRVRITVIGPDGAALGDSGYAASRLPSFSRLPEIAAILKDPSPYSREHTQSVRADGMHVAVPVVRHGRLLAVVRVNLSLADLEDQIRGLRVLLLGTVLMATVAAVSITLIVTRSILEPIREVTDAAQRMAAGDLARRVVASPDDEIGQLTRSFNTMAARIQEMMEALEGERQKMAQLFEHMTDGVLVVDEHVNVLMMNPAAEGIVGIRAAECLGRPLAEAAAPAELHSLASRALETQQEHEEEVHRRRPEEQVLDVYAAPVSDLPGAPRRVMLVLRDWTETWRTDRMRRELVANASHELRTPIAAVKIMAETLLSGADEDPQARRRFLHLMEREADRLSTLVSDLLDLSQMEAGQWPLAIQPFPLGEALESALAKHQVAAQERHQALALECPPALQVLADRAGLALIFGNLVENAVKYTPEGGEIRVAAAAGDACVRVSVRDSGIGIPPEHLGRIFERFYRVDKARSREQGGSGLGLAIVAHLVEAQGGTIAVESEPGKGSTFVVTLPAPPGGEVVV